MEKKNRTSQIKNIWNNIKNQRTYFVMASVILLLLSVSSIVFSQQHSKSDYLQKIETHTTLDHAYTWYRVCNPIKANYPISRSEDFNIGFNELKNRISSYTYSIRESNSRIVDDYDYACTPITVTVPANPDNGSEEWSYVRENCVYTKVGSHTETIYDWKEFIPTENVLKPETCYDIKVEADYPFDLFGVSIDNILNYAGYTFDEFDWWNSSVFQEEFDNASGKYINTTESTVIFDTEIATNVYIKNTSNSRENYTLTDRKKYDTSSNTQDSLAEGSGLRTWGQGFNDSSKDNTDIFTSFINTQSGWVIFDLNASNIMNRFLFRDRGNSYCGAGGDYTIYNWTLQASDNNQTWIVVLNKTSDTTDGFHNYTFTPTKARYWRFEVLTHDGAHLTLCWGGLYGPVYEANSTIVSANLNSSRNISAATFTLTSTSIPSSTNITCQMHTANNAWENVVNGTEKDLVDGTGLFYRCNLSTTDTIKTPEINNLTITVRSVPASESEGDTAIENGINDTIAATIYTNQQIYTRYLNTTQIKGSFDKVAVFGNQRWAFNYITTGESYVNMTNMTPTLYMLEITSKTSQEIRSEVSGFINNTKV